MFSRRRLSSTARTIQRRDGVVLATKANGPMSDEPNRRGNSRRWIVRAVEDSLRRLNTDWIDLYQMHRQAPGTDIDETLGALSDLVHAGKVRYIGSSTFQPSALVEAHWSAERRGRERFVSEQPPYSILARGVEGDVLPVCRRLGMAVIPWSPLGGGWLTGAYRAGGEQPGSARSERLPDRYDLSRPDNQRKLAAAEALALLAAEAGISLIHLAIAFTLTHPAVTAPIIGPRTMAQLESQLGAAAVVLGADVLDRIDEIVPPGTTISTLDAGWVPPALAEPGLRRRSRPPG